MSNQPSVLCISGYDSSLEAGIALDAQVVRCCGSVARGVLTAMTSQNAQRVTAVAATPTELLQAQWDVALECGENFVVKAGMLAETRVVDWLARQLERHPPRHFVLDPVFVSTSGQALLDARGIERLRRHLLPKTSVLTPNKPETEVLVRGTIANHGQLIEAGHTLLQQGCEAVLLKGGHYDEPEAVDRLFWRDRVVELRAPRLGNLVVRGTGCFLASSIAAFLAQGHDILAAATIAKQYLHACLQHAVAMGETRLSPEPFVSGLATSRNEVLDETHR